jgi:hypothetical protein
MLYQFNFTRLEEISYTSELDMNATAEQSKEILKYSIRDEFT